MTQPNFVPITEADQIRPALQLETPGHWLAIRPAEIQIPRRQGGRGTGTPGPDQGFALRLAKGFKSKLRLSADENSEDVMVGCALVGSKRSGIFGRAPSVYDVNVAFTVFGFLLDAPQEFLEWRRPLFRSASHDYVVQRAIVDLVSEDVLALNPEKAKDWFLSGGWRQLVPDAHASAPG